MGYRVNLTAHVESLDSAVRNGTVTFYMAPGTVLGSLNSTDGTAFQSFVINGPDSAPPNLLVAFYARSVVADYDPGLALFRLDSQSQIGDEWNYYYTAWLLVEPSGVLPPPQLE